MDNSNNKNRSLNDQTVYDGKKKNSQNNKLDNIPRDEVTFEPTSYDSINQDGKLNSIQKQAGLPKQDQTSKSKTYSNQLNSNYYNSLSDNPNISFVGDPNSDLSEKDRTEKKFKDDNLKVPGSTGARIGNKIANIGSYMVPNLAKKGGVQRANTGINEKNLNSRNNLTGTFKKNLNHQNKRNNTKFDDNKNDHIKPNFKDNLDKAKQQSKSKDSVNKENEVENNERKNGGKKQSPSIKALNTIKAMATILINVIVSIFTALGGLTFGIIIIVVIILIALASQVFKFLNVDETGNINCMNITSCDTVIIPNGPSAGTYTIDDYLAGAVNYYFGTNTNPEVYRAMGVIVNTDLNYYSNIDYENATCTLNNKNKFNNLSIVKNSDFDTDDTLDQSDEEENATHNYSIIAINVQNSKTEIIVGYSSSINPNENSLNSTSDYKTIIKDYLRVEELKIEKFGIYKICSMSGSENLPYVDMNVCDNVTITNGKFMGTYTLDDYVAGVINHEVGGFKDEETFKVFSVAARTYLLTRSKNVDGVCYMIDSNDTQKFTPTTDSLIINAVAQTSGQVMTDGNGNLISTEYDSFCYASKDQNYYYLAQKNQAIPISWAYANVPKWSKVEFLENPCGTDGDGGHGRGMSQYGAYYMSTEESKNYNEILSFYYDAGTLSTTIKGDSINGEVNSYGLMNPLETTGNCSSLFGNRIHPITYILKSHGGIDIARAANTPIYAAQDGTVTVNGYDKDGYGYYVIITGNNGISTVYAHMIRPSNLQINQTVTAGTLVGYVGQTGAATGNHLHFEIRVNGTRVDPLQYLPSLCG